MDLASHLHWLLLFALVTPVVVHLHELGHAAAALRLTRDSVVVQGCFRTFRAVGIGRLQIALGVPSLSGVCFHADAGRRGNGWIAAAGPAASLLAGLAAGTAWLAGNGGDLLAAFALANLLTGVVNLLPLHLAPASGIHAAAESDGQVILRALGLARPRRAGARRPLLRWPFAVLLGLVAVLAAFVAPVTLLPLAACFGYGWWASERSLH
jgi:hypothetical protein